MSIVNFHFSTNSKIRSVCVPWSLDVCVAWSLVDDLLQSFSLSLGMESVVVLESACPINEDADTLRIKEKSNSMSKMLAYLLKERHLHQVKC